MRLPKDNESGSAIASDEFTLDNRDVLREELRPIRQGYAGPSKVEIL
jgi:hypothetical protein